jgi:hypothetical protein
MVLKPEPVFAAIEQLQRPGCRIGFISPRMEHRSFLDPIARGGPCPAEQQHCDFAERAL